MTAAAIFAIALVLADTVPAHTQAIDSTTSCTVVGAVMDREAPDLRKVREITSYIEENFRTVDRSYKIRGKVEIVPRLSREGLNKLIAATTVRCRDEANRTIQEVALEVYDGVREMQKLLGLAD